MNGTNSIVNQCKRLSGRVAGIYARQERGTEREMEQEKKGKRKTGLNEEVCGGATVL